MNKLNGIILLTGLTLSATAQQRNFLYIQTDNGQPFYVKNGTEVLSSSVHGHLVIPGLADSVVEFRMGFPKGEVAEQQFTYAPGGKDQGVVLKHFGEKGWGLFNLQTLAVTYSGSAGAVKHGGNMVEETNAIADTLPGNTGGNIARPGGFIDRLALVVDDPSIRIKPEVPVVKKEAVKQEVVKQAQPKVDSAVLVKESSLPDKAVVEKKEEAAVKTDLASENSVSVDSAQLAVQSDKERVKIQEKKEGKTEEGKVTPVSLKSNVVKKSMTKLDTGHMGIFIDEYSNGKRDTIKVFIPQDGLDAPIKEKEEVKEVAGEKEDVAFLDFSLKNGEGNSKNNGDSAVKTRVDKDTLITAGVDAEQAFVDSVIAIIDGKEIKDSVVVEEIIDTAIVVADTAVVVNPETASEADMLQLRRKMAAKTTEEDMVDVARKEFRRQKYAVAQIRHLAALFLKEEGRYAFLDAAYSSVTDKEQFFTLEDLLKDPYYINRFKALLGK
ncbi:MAG: DUF4476 domain-containing protein [Chitinophagaceae bacterium]